LGEIAGEIFNGGNLLAIKALQFGRARHKGRRTADASGADRADKKKRFQGGADKSTNGLKDATNG